MVKKINVGILFGGKSAEHEVSLESARNVYQAIDRDKFNPVLIGIDKDGQWLLQEDSRFLLNSGQLREVRLNDGGSPIALIPRGGGTLSFLNGENRAEGGGKPVEVPVLDVVFPILHGPFGEDGTVQGLLKLAGIPFVGSGVLGSALGMDKDVMKRLLRDEDIPIGKFLALRSHEKIPSYREVAETLGSPVFIKPANMGSSVGIAKVHGPEEYQGAVEEAFRYDSKIVIEEFIRGRELECAVLGNEEVIASVPGEVIPRHEFYSYDAKYLDEHGATLVIPARLSEDTREQVKKLAVRTFTCLCCEGLSRVDFFLRETGGDSAPDILVNEINTMPGFTRISMYPKLWEAGGISYTELITRLIELAISRFQKEQDIVTSRF
ncbi:MAG: D-alanine--D-alanine ligase [Treponema sp.]|jgi:D-alanine-D-alanine ligase|nr:D-alanine--D-alanine ligase [Treponema sp.]